ncbi:MAG: hypothetical protein K5900_12475 [Butyrivibrio sp.]|nr:hypothetical protein [Butyrivibrio sp.]
MHFPSTIAFGEDALKEYAENLTKEKLVGWDKEITDDSIMPAGIRILVLMPAGFFTFILQKHDV